MPTSSIPLKYSYLFTGALLLLSIVASQSRRGPVRRRLRRIGRESRRADAADGAVLVLVGGVAADADRADDGGTVADEDAARDGNETAVGGGGQRAHEVRTIGEPIAQRPARLTHAERAPRLADRDVGTEDARAVLALERDELTAGVEHGDGQRHHGVLSSGRERRLDDHHRLLERDARHGQRAPDRGRAAAMTSAACFATAVPSKKLGFPVPQRRTAFANVKSRKSSALTRPSSSSS